MVIEINNPQIEEYIKNFIEVDDVILEMEKLAKQQNFPIVDRVVGKFLYFITKLKNPKLIVEIGSGFGYSAYWFAKALNEGNVVLTDYKFENLNLAEEFFRKGHMVDKAVFRYGDGIEIAREYIDIDILFLDLEKARYLEAVQTLEMNLAPNSLVIADNVLWHGKVLDPNPDEKTKKIKEFTDYMFKNFDTTILPIRDGVLLSFVR